MQINKLPYTLGIDIGIASTGAALLLPDQILALHVRTFDKAETDKEGDSLNKIRREARSTRRRLRRRVHRLLRLTRLFKRCGLIAEANPVTFALPTSPWQLRADGLDRQLTPPEWTSVLYHLLKHRGFQSTRKSERKQDEKLGQMLGGVSRNQQLLQDSGLRTVGELAARHPQFANAKRNKGGTYSHTFARQDILQELRLLFAQQRQLNNPHTDCEFEQQVEQLLMARRPALAGDQLLKMVGYCTFEPNQHRAPKASYRAERFIWLGKLNNLRILSNGEARTLTPDERQHLLELPFTQTKLTFKQTRKTLNLASHQHFNLLSYRAIGKKDPEEALLFEAKAFHTLRKTYEAAGLQHFWQRDALDPDRLDALAFALTVYKDDSASRDWLMQQGVEPEIIEAVLDESFDQFIALSTKALAKLLPYLEEGQRYDEAASSAGYQHHQPQTHKEQRGTLPAPDRNLIRNPVVYRALNQARKLINAVIHEYGPPAAVHIELARDLTKPFAERKQIEREQENYRAEKQSATVRFIEEIGREPHGNELLKMRLYHEQMSQCPYCQGRLDIGRLYNAQDVYAQIDHALPFSRSFDDSLNNKVLVHTACNQNKGNRTPYEFLNGENNSPAWQLFQGWVISNPNIRQAKRSRLLRINFGQDESEQFKARNLNDTRYIGRELKRLLETHLVWHPNVNNQARCVVLSGQLTALLRARWDLHKDRQAGDLHHAQDAAVIAAASRAMVQRMAGYAKRRELSNVRGNFIDPETGEVLDLAGLRLMEQHFPMPWPHFRKELEARLSANPPALLAGLPGYVQPQVFKPIRVSRAPTRRGLGAAHQDTIRSIRGKQQSAVKIPLTKLKLKDLPNMVGYDDPRNQTLITAIRQRLEDYNDNGNKAFAEPLYKPSAPGKTAPLIRSVCILSTQKSGLPVRNGIANNDSMIRADLFSKNGKFYIVPLYVADAARTDGQLPNRAVVANKHEAEWLEMDASYTFLFSLHPNDWVTVRLKGEVREGYYAGLDRATGAISLWLHDRNQAQAKNGLLRSIGIKTALAVEKYHVDLLGNLHRVQHETRQPLRQAKRKP